MRFDFSQRDKKKDLPNPKEAFLGVGLTSGGEFNSFPNETTRVMLLHYLHHSCPPKCPRPYHSSLSLCFLFLFLLSYAVSFSACFVCSSAQLRYTQRSMREGNAVVPVKCGYFFFLQVFFFTTVFSFLCILFVNYIYSLCYAGVDLIFFLIKNKIKAMQVLKKS